MSTNEEAKTQATKAVQVYNAALALEFIKTNTTTALPFWRVLTAADSEQSKGQAKKQTKRQAKELANDQCSKAVQIKSGDFTTTFTCHICETEVPKTHMNIHFQGAKHQTCLQIAYVGLDRAKRQMNLEVQPRCEQNKHSYFCDPCSIVMHTRDKTLHEESETHLDNVQFYNFLRIFAAFYINGVDNNCLSESDTALKIPAESAQTKSTESLIEEESEVESNHLKEAPVRFLYPQESDPFDTKQNKDIQGLKLNNMVRTLDDQQEELIAKESLCERTIKNLNQSAEKALLELKKSTELNYRNDLKKLEESNESHQKECKEH